MRKFVVNLFSNHFGIFLATLNVCYLATKIQDIFKIPQTFLGKVFVCLNMPAFILARLSYEFVTVFTEIHYSRQMTVKLALFSFFAVLQWLFIAWFARTLAAKIRRPQL